MLLSVLLLFGVISPALQAKPLSIGCVPAEGTCEAPISAKSIVDSIGVDIHLHYQNTAYGDFPLVEGLLKDLGVRHTRDGVVDTTWQEYYMRHKALGSLGIRCLFLTAPSMSDALLKSWPGRVPGAFEGFEAPNEYDRSGAADWPDALKVFLERLNIIVKSDPISSEFPIVGPSLTKVDSYNRMTGSEKYFDYSNMHNYLGGHNPGTHGWGDGGYGSIAYNIDLARRAWPEKPLMTTETGYITDLKVPQGIPESVAAKYLPRLIFEQALHKISRTYIYELIDEGAQVAGDAGYFGLARADGSRKASFTALRDLISTLSDDAPPSPPPNLEFSLLNTSESVHHILLAKSDGSYYLAFWLEKPAYDLNKHAAISVSPETFTFISKRAFSKVDFIRFDEKGILYSKAVDPMSRMLLTATDCVSFVVLR